MAEPAITMQAYHTSSGSNYPVSRVVIHATCPGIGFPGASANGQSQATANYFTSGNSGGSAHYVRDPSREDHCVHDVVIAWHAPPNRGSVGIEICAESSYSRDQWLSGEVRPVLEEAARRTAELCQRFSIPVRKIGPSDLIRGARGVCGHVDVSQTWHQSDHTDPGSGFPWDVFMQMAQHAAGAPVVSPPPQHQPGQHPRWPGRVIVLGEYGSDVHIWQQQMAHRGWRITVDGQYGPASVTACRSFQQEKGLGVDGKVGPATWDATWTAPL